MTENEFVWLENELSTKEMKKMIASCDKDCKTCTNEELREACLENREVLFSLVNIVENLAITIARLTSSPPGAMYQ